MIASDVLISIFVLFIGFFLGYIFHRWLAGRKQSSGTLHVIRDREKILYSLELRDYPESLVFKKEVIFKVDTSEQSPDRDQN